MKILATTNHLFGLSGSEITVVTIAEHLTQQGHDVALHARFRSADFVATVRERGITVLDELERMPADAFDVAYTQHHTSALAVRFNFPRLPILHASLGVLPDLEQPPVLDLGISRFLALSEEVHDNLVSQGVPAKHVAIFRNIVDGARFTPSGPVSKTPRRALVLSYKIDEARLSLIRESCARLGINVVKAPERPGASLSQEQVVRLINEVDIVFSLGRGVIEAMMCGRVPFVLDYLGGDGLVTPDNVMSLAECNFSGRRHRRDYSPDELTEELRTYNAEAGFELRTIALSEFDADKGVTRLVAMLREAQSSYPRGFTMEPPLAVERVFRAASVSREFGRMERDLDMMGLEQALRRGHENVLQQARGREAVLTAELAKAAAAIKTQTNERERLKSELARERQKSTILEKALQHYERKIARMATR